MSAETPPNAPDWRRVYRTSDLVRARLIVGALATEGLTVRQVGWLDGQSMGAGNSVAAAHIEVAAQDVPLAETILARLLAEAPDGPRPLSPRRGLVATGLAAIFPGLGHFYARQPVAATLLVAACVPWALPLYPEHWPYVLGLTWIGSVLVAARAARQAREVRVPSALRQAATVAVLFGVSLAIIWPLRVYVTPVSYVAEIAEDIARDDDAATRAASADDAAALRLRATRQAAETCLDERLSPDIVLGLCMRAARALSQDPSQHEDAARCADRACDADLWSACELACSLGVRARCDAAPY